MRSGIRGMVKKNNQNNMRSVSVNLPARLFTSLCAFLSASVLLTAQPGNAIAENSGHKGTPSTTSPLKLIKAALGAHLGAGLAAKGFEPGARAYIRIFKETSELEVWLKDTTDSDQYRRFKTYQICKWSGKIGPKIFEGDKQSPEGFYAFSPWQLRSQSRNFRAIDIGFPNDLDIALGRSGSDIQIHGGCGSVGCYAMTDENIDEIFRLTAAAFGGGQQEIMVHAFPFRMSLAALAKRKSHPWSIFWKNLKPVYDEFEKTHIPPAVNLCGRQYGLTANVGEQKNCTLLKAPTATEAGKRRALARAARPKPRIKVRCNLKRPSCKKWLFLQKRILARKDAAKARRARRTARR